MVSHSLRWLAGFAALAFTALFARADENDFNDNLTSIISRKPDPVNDYALGWLQQIFGDFIFYPWGGATVDTGVEATLVAHAIGFTNVVALILGIVIVGYVFLAGTINTASQGEVLGKSWSTIWLPLRTATAFGLITPVVGVGGGVVSLVQAFVLSLLIIGSNAATLLWEKIGDQIAGGTVLVANHEPVGMTPGLTAMKALTCAQAVYDYNVAKKNDDKYIARIGQSDGTQHFVDGPIGSATFPINDESLFITFGTSKFKCGQIIFGMDPANLAIIEGEYVQTKGKDSTGEIAGSENITKKYHAQAIEVGLSAARPEVQKLITSLAPVVDIMMKSHNDNGLGGGENMLNQLDSGEEASVAAIEAAANLYGSASRSFSSGFPKAVKDAIANNKAITDAWHDDLRRGGWGAAGMWFFEISRMQTLSDSVINKVVGSVSSTEALNFCGWYNPKGWMSNCDTYSERATADISAGAGLLHSLALAAPSAANASAAERAQDRLDAMSEGNVDKKFFDALAVRMSQSILNFAAGDGNLGGKEGVGGEGTTSTVTNGLASPFVTVTNIGNTLNKGAGIAWVTGLAMKSFGGALEKIPVIGGAVSGGSGWIVTTIMAVIASLVSMGFILSFLIPFMPIITWIRLLASYLLTAIEAVVAAPLAVIMMATPEGEGISGTRLERAIQLLAAVILKPTLMIIGLVSAVLLGFVTFGILNLMFWQVAAAVTDSGLFELMAILVTYTMAAFQICKASIMIMHKIPDQILDWMAGGVGGRSFGDDAESGIEQGMGETKGALSGVSNSLMRSRDEGGKAGGEPPAPKDKKGRGD